MSFLLILFAAGRAKKMNDNHEKLFIDPQPFEVDPDPAKKTHLFHPKPLRTHQEPR